MLKLPTIKELLAGLCDDGTLPPLHSAKLYPPGESPVAAKQKSRAELLSEQIVLRGLMDQLEDLEACREWHLLCLKAGKRALAEVEPEAVEHGVTEQQSTAEAHPGSGTSSAGSMAEKVPDPVGESGDAEKGSGSAKRCLTPFSPESGPPEMVSGTGTARSQTPFPAPESGAIPDSPTPIPVARAGVLGRSGASSKGVAAQPRNTKNARITKDAGSTESPASPSSVSPLLRVKNKAEAQIKPLSVATLAERAARALPKVTQARVAVLREVAKLAAAIDMRSAFLHDRAHSVVVDTLFAMDEAFEEVGFGSWMPFRYPDQFILFTGLLSRVLAANGLIAAKHPDIYRRLLDETPPVEREPETPMGIAKCASVQPVKRLETLWRMVSGP